MFGLHLKTINTLLLRDGWHISEAMQKFFIRHEIYLLSWLFQPLEQIPVEKLKCELNRA